MYLCLVKASFIIIFHEKSFILLYTHIALLVIFCYFLLLFPVWYRGWNVEFDCASFWSLGFTLGCV